MLALGRIVYIHIDQSIGSERSSALHVIERGPAENPNIQCQAKGAVCLGRVATPPAYETHASCVDCVAIINGSDAPGKLIPSTLIASLDRAGEESVPTQAQRGASGQGGHPGAVPEPAAVRAQSFRPTRSTPPPGEGPQLSGHLLPFLANRAFDVVLKDVAARSERAPTVRMSDLSAHAGQHDEGSSDEDDDATVPSTSGDAHVADPVQLAAAAKCVRRPAREDRTETLTRRIGRCGVEAGIDAGRAARRCGRRSRGNAAFGAGDHGAAFTHYSNALAWCVTRRRFQ